MNIKLAENAKKKALEMIAKGIKVYANADGHLFTNENSARLSKKQYKELSESEINNEDNDEKKKAAKNEERDFEKGKKETKK